MCYEHRDEEFANVCKERDELRKRLEDREAFHEACQRVANRELNRLRAERDYLYDLVEGTCTACKHNGVPEWPCHRCGDDEDLWEYGWEWEYG